MYLEHRKQQQAPEWRKEGADAPKKAHKRKLDEMKAEEKNLHVQWQKVKEEQNAAQESLKCAMKYIYEGGKKIGDGLKNWDVMEVKAWNKPVEFIREKQSHADKRMSEVIDEITKVESQLLNVGKDKKLKS